MSFYLIWELLQEYRKKKERWGQSYTGGVPISTGSSLGRFRRTEETEDLEQAFFHPVQAPEGAVPRYAVLDLQTTGLSTEQGVEDRIVEASWMILDADLSEISHHIIRVQQPDVGDYKARKVHRLTPEILQYTGEPEQEALRQLWESIKEVPLWVFHNAHFDLSILRGGLQRLMPEALPHFLEHPALCTMLALVGDLDHGDKYKSLHRLFDFFFPNQIHVMRLPSVVSWRNVCLTRACLNEIVTCYHEYLEEDGERKVSYYISLDLENNQYLCKGEDKEDIK